MTGQPGGDERDAAALDRFWDQVVSGGAAQNPAVDPGDARVVEALHRQAQRQRPDPRFVARLEGQLMASPARSLAPADLRSRLSVKNGRISPLARVEAVAAPPVRRGQQALWRLATAALLLLAVGLGALAFQRLTELIQTGASEPRSIRLEPVLHARRSTGFWSAAL